MSKSRQITYSQALTELEQIIGEIEAEDVDVDVLAGRVKRATFLITFCKDRLRSTAEELKKVFYESGADEAGGQGNADLLSGGDEG